MSKAKLSLDFPRQSTISKIFDDLVVDYPPLQNRYSSPTSISRIIRAISRLPCFSRTTSPPPAVCAPFYGNKGAEACYKAVVDLFECDDTDIISTIRRQPPLPHYIMHVLLSTDAPSAVIKDTIVFIYRYHSTRAKNDVSGGHLIFTCAFMRASSLHLPKGVASLSNDFWAGTTGYSVRTVAQIQETLFHRMKRDVRSMKRKEKKFVKSLRIPLSPVDESRREPSHWPSRPVVYSYGKHCDVDDDDRWSVFFVDGPYNEKVQMKTKASPRPMFLFLDIPDYSYPDARNF